MRNISVRIILAVLLVASLGCAKVLTAKTNYRVTRGNSLDRALSKAIHGDVKYCTIPEVTVKYNPATDRGQYLFGKGCDINDTLFEVLIRAYDADGFQINAFFLEKHFEPRSGYHIMGTTLTTEERQQVRRISIDFVNLDNSVDEHFYQPHSVLDCPAGREFNEDEFNCDRICPDDKFYDKYTDKCLDLYDSKETAAYEPPDEPVDTQVADVSSYWPGYGPGYDTDNYKTDGNTYYDQYRKEQWRPEPDSDCPLNKMIGGRCQY